MFDINPGELLLLVVLAVVLVGPDKLPQYAGQLASLVRRLRGLASDAKERVADELGVDASEFEKLDPRRYDPRRIVKDAILDTGAAAGLTGALFEDPVAPPPPDATPAPEAMADPDAAAAPAVPDAAVGPDAPAVPDVAA